MDDDSLTEITHDSPAIPRRRSGLAMMTTMIGWHVLVVGVYLRLLASQPIDPSCEFACSPGDAVLFGVIFAAIPVAISLIVSELLIVVQLRQARMDAVATGREPAPASRWRDCALATGMTLAGMLSSAAAITAYGLVRDLL
jgi:hypothetical protein